MAMMFARASERATEPSQERAFLLRAEAYAKAALSDYQHYQGRAIAEEARANELINKINQALEKLPQ